MGRPRGGRKFPTTVTRFYLDRHHNLCLRIFIRGLSMAPLANLPISASPNSDFYALLGLHMKKLFRFLVVGTLCGIMIMATPLPNYRLLSVVSGSMEPTIQTGAIIAVTTHENLLEPGDVITFHLDDILITHRIIDLGFDGDFYYTTKGDANQNPDPYRVRRGQVYGKVIYVTPPKLAAFLYSSHSFDFRYVLLLLPIAFILYHGANKFLASKRQTYRRTAHMVSWLCPHCNKRMYSAYDSREKMTITCLYCETTIINPYYQKRLSLATEHKPSQAKAYYK